MSAALLRHVIRPGVGGATHHLGLNMTAIHAEPVSAIDPTVSQQALLTGLATNLYLTALALCLSNRLVSTSDSSLITALARSAPPAVSEPESVAASIASLGLDDATAQLCMALLDLQARARRELEFPSGPQRLFRPALTSHVALQRLWQSAAENGLEVLSRVLAVDCGPTLARERLIAAHVKLGNAVDGTMTLSAEEIAGVLPVWIRRRRHTRQAISVSVTIWARDRRERGQVLDISQGGALLLMKGSASRGDKLQVEFPGRRPITAIIQWTHDTRVGVKFVEPLEQSDPLLAAEKTAAPVF
jgi:PilZ domain